MSTRIQRRGGDAASHATFIGAPREITINTTDWSIHVHDGSTPGGHRLAKTSEAITSLSALAGFEHLPWLAVPIGGIIELPTNLAGVAMPPTNVSSFRYAQLSAGLSGAGGYNEGVLGSELVSGSAPLVQATAVVSLAGSPLNGQTIRLLNTEGRFIRPGTSPGTVANDTFQDHGHHQMDRSSGAGSIFGNSFAFGTSPAGVTGLASALGYRTGTETAPKHIQMRFFMRVK